MNITVQKVNGGVQLSNLGVILGKLTYKQAETLGYALIKMANLGLTGKS